LIGLAGTLLKNIWCY